MESETEWVQLRRKSWAALIRLVYEADPLLCPKCGTQMKIVSVTLKMRRIPGEGTQLSRDTLPLQQEIWVFDRYKMTTASQAQVGKVDVMTTHILGAGSR